MLVNVSIFSYLFAMISQNIFVAYCRDHVNFFINSFQNSLFNMCLFFLYHYNLRCLYLIDIVCADFPQNKMRFFLTYNFYSVLFNIRLLFSFFVDNVYFLFSITHIFPVSNWMEREIFDLYGLIFHRHPDLRRILTDYGFVGNPLKKDYPLSGYIEVHYDSQYQCVMSNMVNLVQDFRYFFFEHQ